MKRKQLAKTFAMLLSTSMLLSACGATDTSSQEVSSSGSESSQPVTESVNEPEVQNYWEMLNEVSDTSELPNWTGEKLEISIWSAAGTDATFGEIRESNVVMKEIERVTGITINVDECFGNGGDNIDAKLPRVIASKDFPTIIYGYDIDSHFQELYDNGYLVDLTPYYEDGSLEHVTYWLPLEEMDELIYGNCRNKDGDLFLIPSTFGTESYWEAAGYYPKEYNAAYYNMYGMTPKSGVGHNTNNAIYVRSDILEALYPDALTFEEIEQIYVKEGSFTEEEIFDIDLNSAEDFYEFLHDVKELIKSGEYVGIDGKPVEVTYGPDSGTDNFQWLTLLPRAIKGWSANTDYFVTSDRTVGDSSKLLQYAFKTDEYVQFFKELNTLVNEDVISQNSLVDNNATFKEKYNNGHYAVVYGDNYPRPYEVKDSEGEWSYRPIWINVPTNVDFGGYNSLPRKMYYGIFKNDLTEEQIEQLVHFIDYMSSAVGQNLRFWGPESAGYFVEDENGNRTYTDEEFAAFVYEGENSAESELSVDTGIIVAKATKKPFNLFPMVDLNQTFSPVYLNAVNMPRQANDAKKYYNPGVLEGQSLAENSVSVKSGCEAYSLGLKVEGIAEFWTARAGFEDQLKKVLVATPDKFDKELENLFKYAEENGLTEETLKEFNDLFVETNYSELKVAGLVE